MVSIFLKKKKNLLHRIFTRQVMFFMALLQNWKEDQTAASVLQFKDQVHNSVIVGDRTSAIPT